MAFADRPILCSHVQDAVDRNEIIMRRLFAPADVVPVGMSGNAVDDPRLKSWLAKKHFHELPCVAMGCKVMVLDNLDLQKGAANGAIATVQALHHHRNC